MAKFIQQKCGYIASSQFHPEKLNYSIEISLFSSLTELYFFGVYINLEVSTVIDKYIIT